VAASGFIKGEKKSDKEWIINATIKMSLFNRMQNTTAQKEISFERNFVLWEQKKKDKKGYRFYGF
jgi:hypothetical protein